MTGSPSLTTSSKSFWSASFITIGTVSSSGTQTGFGPAEAISGFAVLRILKLPPLLCLAEKGDEMLKSVRRRLTPFDAVNGVGLASLRRDATSLRSEVTSDVRRWCVTGVRNLIELCLRRLLKRAGTTFSSFSSTNRIGAMMPTGVASHSMLLLLLLTLSIFFFWSDKREESKKLRVLLHGSVADRTSKSSSSIRSPSRAMTALSRKRFIVEEINFSPCGDGNRGLGVKVAEAGLRIGPCIRLRRS